MGRRRKWDNVGEPLFGEDWWRTDQKLFEDSIIRQTPPPPATRRRPRRRGTIRKRNQPAAPAPVQDMLPWFHDEQPGAAADEPVRGDGPQALGPVASRQVRGDRGPKDVLFRPGEPGGGED